MSAITEGPWLIKWEYNVTSQDGRMVAACGGFQSNADNGAHIAENIANAVAIHALPDLIEAAQAVITQLETPNWKLTEPTGKLIADLRAALTKAGVL